MEYALAVPFITALIESLKMAFLPTKYAPLMSIILGIIYSVVSNNSYTFQAVVWGAILGLSASGLYDSTKKGANAIKSRINDK